MKIPLWMPLRIVIYFPKKLQDDFIDRTWNAKSNDSILVAYDDSIKWIRLGKSFVSDTMKNIAEESQVKLDKYVIPQMKKRGLDYEQ